MRPHDPEDHNPKNCDPEDYDSDYDPEDQDPKDHVTTANTQRNSCFHDWTIRTETTCRPMTSQVQELSLPVWTSAGELCPSRRPSIRDRKEQLLVADKFKPLMTDDGQVGKGGACRWASQVADGRGNATTLTESMT